jgi:hypothetical protein
MKKGSQQTPVQKQHCITIGLGFVYGNCGGFSHDRKEEKRGRV